MHASTRGFALARAVLSVAVSSSMLLMAPSLAAGPAGAPLEATESYADLAARAEAAREAEAHAEAAALWARAYRARPEPRRADPTGEITVRAAMADFELALEEAPDDPTLLRAQAELVREFVGVRTPEASPQDIIDALAELDARLVALEPRPPRSKPSRRDTTGSGTDVPEVPEPSLVITPTSRPTLELDSPRGVPSASNRARKPQRRSSRRVDRALVGLGVTSLATGAAGLAGGGWMLVATHRRAVGYAQGANATIDVADGTDRTYAQWQHDQQQIDAYRVALDEFKRDSNRNAALLLVGGSLLAATGIGLTTWGVLRLRANGRRPGARAALAPALSRSSLGVNARIDF
jgi:hypothetical protein